MSSNLSDQASPDFSKIAVNGLVLRLSAKAPRREGRPGQAPPLLQLSQDSQLTLISLKLAAMQNAVTLYKALGGG
jgi:hypothetical protein